MERGGFDEPRICEHLPKLASISHLWSLCRSLTHPSNDHSAGHHIMLTGQSNLPVGFNPNAPSRTDHPSMVSKVGHAVSHLRGLANNNLPPAACVLYCERFDLAKRQPE
ncbi:MAG: DUF1501 domain-containing protein, partial [Pirellula sp.]